MPNDAYEHMKMLLYVNKNAKIVIECELHANARFLGLMNASSRYWSSIHTNECVFSRNEQQKVELIVPRREDNLEKGVEIPRGGRNNVLVDDEVRQ